MDTKAERFNANLDEINVLSLRTLNRKNRGYGSEDNPLLNFEAGSDISGRTVAQTCFGYLAKHLAALRNMVENNDFSDMEDFAEKCTDSINYIKLLYVIGCETEYQNGKTEEL